MSGISGIPGFQPMGDRKDIQGADEGAGKAAAGGMTEKANVSAGGILKGAYDGPEGRPARDTAGTGAGGKHIGAGDKQVVDEGMHHKDIGVSNPTLGFGFPHKEGREDRN